jgi:hypothetical protein
MSNPNNFAGGFFLGAVVGGVLGGILGATLVSRRMLSTDSGASGINDLDREDRRDRDKNRKRMLGGSSQPDLEMTRRGLEDKIAQLNNAIDEARQQLASPRLESEELPHRVPAELS